MNIKKEEKTGYSQKNQKLNAILMKE